VRLLALCAFFVAAIALAACGGSSIPGNSVAKVGGTSITKDDFNHWLKIAAKQKSAPAPAKGQPAPTTAQYKQQCQTDYNGLRDQVLQFLISAQWIMGEAGDQGVKVTDAEVDK